MFTSKSIFSPAAAMSGTARQQSKSVVLVWLIWRILSKGLRRPEPSAGPPGLILATKMPRSYSPSERENPKSSKIGSLNKVTLFTSCGIDPSKPTKTQFTNYNINKIADIQQKSTFWSVLRNKSHRGKFLLCF